MKKSISKILISTVIVTAISIPAVFASYQSWYSSTIPLPRTGLWRTVARKATCSVQKTQADSKYDIYGRIVSNGNAVLSSYTKHRGGHGDVKRHNKGAVTVDTLKTEFKTSTINYCTARCVLGWAP